MAPLISLLSLVGGATALAISGSYAPFPLPCPNNTQFVRPASQGLSALEKAWLAQRQPNVINALDSYLSAVNITGFNLTEYIAALKSNVSSTPRIGLTFSGGGQRARTIGLGAYNALDNRNPAAVKAGTGGLAQALTYVSGLSGGSQTIVVLAMSDFLTPSQILANGNLIDPSNAQINASIFNEMGAKNETGFNETFADVFAATQFANLVTNSSSIDPFSRLFSDVRSLPNFANGSTPLPFLMYNEVIPEGQAGSLNIQGYLYPAFNSTNTTNYEASPFEWGSWTGRASAFADLAYLGTQFSAGQPTNNTQCVNGFDSAAFMSGSALQAANLWIIQQLTNGTSGQFDRLKRRAIDLEKRQANSTSNNGNPSFYGPSYPADEATIEQQRVAQGTAAFVDGAIPGILQIPFYNNLPASQLTWAQWPNPFQGYNASDKGLQQQSDVLLQDGSETGQINPVWPVIQKVRSPDFLIVSDNSGTELSDGWMNGTNIQVSSAQAKLQGLAFPTIPDPVTMVNNNYTTRPTFFGCNEPNVPLVLYVADAPYTSYTNATPILDSNLTSTAINLIWDNTLANLAQVNGSDSTWPSCIACASIYRSLQRMNISIPQGAYSTDPARYVAPALFLNSSVSFSEWNSTVWQPALNDNIFG